MALAEAKPRRTQAERTASMRSKLLESTVACLVEQGYARTTTTEVVRRAGVSRGAQVHHFPTKQDLVLAAIEHLLERRLQEFRSTFASLEPADRTLTVVLDLLWSYHRADTFAAWLELAVAARTDDHLRRPFLEMERRFAENVAETFVTFHPSSPDPRFSELAVEFAFTVLQGLALKRSLGIDNDADELLDMLEFLVRTFSAETGGTT